jgi:hypothetical protein
LGVGGNDVPKNAPLTLMELKGLCLAELGKSDSLLYHDGGVRRFGLPADPDPRKMRGEGGVGFGGTFHVKNMLFNSHIRPCTQKLLESWNTVKVISPYCTVSNSDYTVYHRNTPSTIC